MRYFSIKKRLPGIYAIRAAAGEPQHAQRSQPQAAASTPQPSSTSSGPPHLQSAPSGGDIPAIPLASGRAAVSLASLPGLPPPKKPRTSGGPPTDPGSPPQTPGASTVAHNGSVSSASGVAAGVKRESIASETSEDGNREKRRRIAPTLVSKDGESAAPAPPSAPGPSEASQGGN